ncbi:AIM24 family protein [Clostridium sp. D43t1_170807_H7]|uniref:AIM24 family protein n=1 Tax=Clostridium sp. D43t1_170807_H7 TaxID=2787140 RepID=UPI00189813AE|nr:AIM24 family protein [Clostridium sp. D43t1_170807_H7]
MGISAIGTRKNVSVIDTTEYEGVKVEILEYNKLQGSTDTSAAMDMYFMEQQNIKARQVAIYLNNDKVRLEPGAMSYFKGNLEMVSGVTAGNLIGKMFSSAVTGESVSQPEYKGTGMIVLEPSFNHFLVLKIDGEIIVDKGMFYCAQGSIQVKPIIQKNISSALAGGEGIFQLSLKGKGIVVLESRVPVCEIDEIHLDNETLKVDGNFAILRSGNISFTVERSAKSLIGSAVSGEGLVNVYRGTGTVWLAPTIKIYDVINRSRAYGISSTTAMNMNTSNSK